MQPALRSSDGERNLDLSRCLTLKTAWAIGSAVTRQRSEGVGGGDKHDRDNAGSLSATLAPARNRLTRLFLPILQSVNLWSFAPTLP
ncbi:hypothetical protein [Ensifer sp. M14]|uniref:hypothetical protein n=1 Tax=Ensifer sp. M14 TaxID=2203782 RepID=UPI000E1D7173|nr:hypothetical protein [Ensifer sp. M14]